MAAPVTPSWPQAQGDPGRDLAARHPLDLCLDPGVCFWHLLLPAHASCYLLIQAIHGRTAAGPANLCLDLVRDGAQSCPSTPLPSASQTRLILPSWLGVADALLAAASSGKRAMLREMYQVRAAMLCDAVCGAKLAIVRRMEAGRAARDVPGEGCQQLLYKRHSVVRGAGGLYVWHVGSCVVLLSGSLVALSLTAAPTSQRTALAPPPSPEQHSSFFQSLVDLIERAPSLRGHPNPNTVRHIPAASAPRASSLLGAALALLPVPGGPD